MSRWLAAFRKRRDVEAQHSAGPLSEYPEKGENPAVSSGDEATESIRDFRISGLEVSQHPTATSRKLPPPAGGPSEVVAAKAAWLAQAAADAFAALQTPDPDLDVERAAIAAVTVESESGEVV